MKTMMHHSQGWLLFVATLRLVFWVQLTQARVGNGNRIKSVFLSPKFVMGPGSVVDKYYHDIDFPRGHVGLKSFNAEVVDEAGHPVPLQETYLHHWVVIRYYQPKNVEASNYNDNQKFQESENILVRNTGICQNNVLGQYFGLGSETRKTDTHVPDPYAIEIGNPSEVPAGYEERWMLNVHAIDTRGVEDRLGCTECRRDLYNITVDQHGQPLSPDYIGGLKCCYDQTQCRVREGLESTKRSLYMRYTVEWVDWDASIVPVKIYIFDVTDTYKRVNDSTGVSATHYCRVEYDVKSCSASSVAQNACIDTKRTILTMPTGGYVIYGVAHQHSGGIGSTLYREDGRVICSSIPTYGGGKEAGNEAGYIVGMSTCYPQPGSVKISNGETLVLESNYNSSQMHTGVMGLFYILVADTPLKSLNVFHDPIQVLTNLKLSNLDGVLALLGVTLVIVCVAYRRRNQRDDGYQSITMFRKSGQQPEL